MTPAPFMDYFLPGHRFAGFTRCQSVERRRGALEALRYHRAACYRCQNKLLGGGDARTLEDDADRRAGGAAARGTSTDVSRCGLAAQIARGGRRQSATAQGGG